MDARPGSPSNPWTLQTAALLALGLLWGLTCWGGELQLGIAARHPDDAGIASDPAVLFADNFETGTMERWDHLRGVTEVVEDAPNSGRFCARMTMIRGQNTGQDAKKWFRGADRVHARFYVRFSADYRYPHHFVTLLANSPTNRWSAFGKAGLRPDGTWFCSGMEPWFAWGRNPPPGELAMYTYFLDMELDRPTGRYYGNFFFPPGPERGAAAGPARVLPALDRWQCWEFMIEANSAPDRADGRQAMWLDGRRIAEFTGLRWRLSPDLKINCFWLQHYGMDQSDPTRAHWPERQTVWFDDVVVATEYIGPKVTRTGGGSTPTAAGTGR
ncbi:MAG: hypothetical protein N2652_06445 [Kiritimatiellae bacterium]|nr:hypothetical protein [Kiritimatiellia bacterium]